MPRNIAETSTRRKLSKATRELKKEEISGLQQEEISDRYSKIHPTKKRSLLIKLFLLFVLVAGGLGIFFKDKFLVAFVNGKPIFRYELNQRLERTFGKETLENLIVEKLIKEEAAKRKILISETDIDREIERLRINLGAGTKLEDVLKYQGISLADFRDQLKLRLLVNKILEDEIAVSDEEISKYLDDNEQSMIASTEAERRAEAQGKIREQKINEQIQTWISELLAKAKITRLF